jgi:PhnB protein
MPVSYVAPGYHTLTPYITVRGAAKAIEFYKQALGATEVMRFEMPGGVIAHAEIQIGESRFMLGEEMPEWGNRGPEALGGTAGGMCVYVPDADAAFARAVAAGAHPAKPVQDQFYGDRSGSVTDPFGHKWTLATHIEDVSVEEMQRRFASFLTAAA